MTERGGRLAGRRIALGITGSIAAYKAVGESAAKPLAYYRNNIGGLLNLCRTMERHGCRSLVFSSSATVYGAPERLPTDSMALTTSR